MTDILQRGASKEHNFISELRSILLALSKPNQPPTVSITSGVTDLTSFPALGSSAIELYVQ